MEEVTMDKWNIPGMNVSQMDLTECVDVIWTRTPDMELQMTGRQLIPMTIWCMRSIEQVRVAAVHKEIGISISYTLATSALIFIYLCQRRAETGLRTPDGKTPSE